jgi:hypothetical protein
MNRRSFWKGLLAFGAGLFGSSATASGVERWAGRYQRVTAKVYTTGIAPVPLGERTKRSFRLEPDGRWLEIDNAQTRKGDRIILLGIDDARGEVWAFHQFTAASDYRPCPEGCCDCGTCTGEILCEDEAEFRV